MTGAVANGVVSILATLLGMLLSGRHSRRKMFFTGQIGVTLSLVLIGLSFKLFFHMETVDGVSGLRTNFTGASYIILALMLVFLTFMQGLDRTGVLADARGNLPAADARSGNGFCGIRFMDI